MPNVYISLGVHGCFRDAPTTLIGLCSSSAYSVSLPGKYVLVTMDIEKKKVRNWSQEEVATLVDSVLENKEVIQSRHKEADTNLKKK